MSFTDEYFHCENCNGELVAESDKLASEEMGDGDDNARRRRREKLKDMLQKMEVRLNTTRFHLLWICVTHLFFCMKQICVTHLFFLYEAHLCVEFEY